MYTTVQIISAIPNVTDRTLAGKKLAFHHRWERDVTKVEFGSDLFRVCCDEMPRVPAIWRQHTVFS